MHAFEYHRPSTTKDALALGAQKSEGRYLAGGQSLVQAMKLRLSSPSDLIDLAAISDLKALSGDAGSVTIGAMVRHADVAASPAVQKAIPALAQLAGIIGDRQVRHMGTILGPPPHTHPPGGHPPPGPRLEPGELITQVAFPAPKRAAYMKFKNPASRSALVGVFVADFGNGAVRVGVTGAGACAFRQAEMEKALSQKFAPESVAGIKVKARSEE